jgi:hypothetical protein
LGLPSSSPALAPGGSDAPRRSSKPMIFMGFGQISS